MFFYAYQWLIKNFVFKANLKYISITYLLKSKYTNVMKIKLYKCSLTKDSLS